MKTSKVNPQTLKQTVEAVSDKKTKNQVNGDQISYDTSVGIDAHEFGKFTTTHSILRSRFQKAQSKEDELIGHSKEIHDKSCPDHTKGIFGEHCKSV